MADMEYVVSCRTPLPTSRAVPQTTAFTSAPSITIAGYPEGLFLFEPKPLVTLDLAEFNSNCFIVLVWSVPETDLYDHYRRPGTA